MKKLLLIVFSCFYLFSSAGVVLNLHYCGGKVKSISLAHTDEAGCCKGKMKKKGCCKEKSSLVKIKDTQAATKTVQLPVHQTIHLRSVSETPALRKAMAKLSIASRRYAPPDLYQSPPYLRHRILLI